MWFMHISHVLESYLKFQYVEFCDILDQIYDKIICPDYQFDDFNFLHHALMKL